MNLCLHFPSLSFQRQKFLLGNINLIGNLGEGKKYTYPGGPTCGHLFSCPPAEKHPFRSEHSVLDWVCGEGRAAAQVSWTMVARVKTVRSIQSFIVSGKRATFWSSSWGRVGLYGIRADYSYSETGLTPPAFSSFENYVNRYNIHMLYSVKIW